MNYQKARTHAFCFNETNDCSVKAVSISCDVPYIVAHTALKKNGRKKRRGAVTSTIRQSFIDLGFKSEPIRTTAATVKTLENDPAVQKGYFVAMVNRHILAIVNGKIEDHSEGSRRRIMQVYKVTPATTRKEREEKRKALMKG